LVAKILVADDNSNIQKMVGLALKDQGIDVVAVGNGEAAVRKIADLRPDLVLADVFMPVRNGYEVCQFVKMDSTLAHIPVILLVGAFDPLDEQEAQRVGADGVLKKPFIPPDPLISMVKSALQRAGVAQAGAHAPKAAEPEALHAADKLAPSSTTVPTVGAAPIPTFPESPSPAATHESFVEDVPARPEPIRIDAGAQPVAFGSLLETPAEEPEEELVTSTPPEFALQRDWRDKDEEVVEEEEEEEEPAAWRREGEEEETQAAKSKKSKSGVTDWRTGGFEQIAASKSRNTGWEPEEEKPEAVETVPAASNRVTEIPAPAAPPAAVPQTPAVSAKPFGADAWGAPAPPAPAVANEKHSVETVTAVEDRTTVTGEQKPASAEKKEAKESKESKDSWFSVSSSPWEAEIQKANQLASAWDAPKSGEAHTGPANGTQQVLEDVSPETQAVIEEAALPPATVEAIREEAAQVTEDATSAAGIEAPSGEGFYARDEIIEAVETPAAAAPPETASNMDDLVARVLAKMSPDVLQAVTREILKPVVEAMVKEELKSKKS
jgi:CheY-like chemotaxis protein